MFKVIKQGDIYKLMYAAKNFQTGLSDVQAIPYNPSGVAQTAVALSEIGSSGVYWADYDTTGKTLGVWGFKFDSATKPAPAIDKIQIVDGDTLNDTFAEKLDTMLDTALTNIGIIDTNVDAIKADVTDSADHSNAALKTLLDAINSAVTSLQNNADAKVALPDVMLIPVSGTSTFKIYVNTLNGNGMMDDPDDQDPGSGNAYVAISVANAGGTDRSANLGGLDASTWESKKWMTRVSQGRFSCTYAVANTHAVEELIFTIEYEEAGDQEVSRAVTVADVSGSLSGKYYWIFGSDKSYYIWIDVDNGSSDPNPTVPGGAPATKVGIEANITSGADASAVATAIRSAINAQGDFAATGSSATVDATYDSPYNTRDSQDGDSGFTISTPVQGNEGGYRLRDAASRTASSASDYGSRFDSIDSALTVIDGNVDDIEGIVGSVSYGNAALKTLIDAIQADIDDGTNGLAAIKTAVTSNYTLLTNATYGLSALKSLIDTVTGYVDGVESDLTAIKGTSWASGDNLHNIANDVKPGGIAI